MTDEVDRDAVRSNADVLKIAIEFLGYRVSVKTCAVHIEALYAFMKIPCPRSLART